MKVQDLIEAWRNDSTVEEQNELMVDPSFREQVYDQLQRCADARDIKLLRHFLDLEVDYRGDDSNDGEYFENLYWCGLFLYQFGDLEDVLPMWRAKNINMNTGCGFDIQFLMGAGICETLVFLSESNEPEAKAAHKYIESCLEAGDFVDLPSWLQGRIEYYN